jgi:hypothetical protein
MQEQYFVLLIRLGISTGITGYPKLIRAGKTTVLLCLIKTSTATAKF